MSSLGTFVRSIADQLRGVYKPHRYGDVILPFTILRRLDYLYGFSASIDVFERFEFEAEIATLEGKHRLYLVVSKFAEASNEEAGEHHTPRDAIRLMVDLLHAEENLALLEPGIVRSIYDPTAGSGGMLSVAEERLVAKPGRPGMILALPKAFHELAADAEVA